MKKTLSKEKEDHDRAYHILNTIRIACYELDKNSCFIFVNRKAAEFFNMKKEELLGKNVWDVFPESIHTHCFIAINDALRKERFSEHEYISAVSGTWIHLCAIPSAAGAIVQFNEIAEPVRVSAQKLEKEHNDLKQSQYIAHVGSFRWTLATGLAEWSDEMFRIHGLPPQSEIINRERILSFTYPEDVPELTQLFETASIKSGPFEMTHRIIRTDGELRWVKRIGESVADENGHIIYAQGTMQDITDRKISELILENIQEVCFVLDSDFRFTYANPRSYKVWKKAPADILGKNVWSVFPEDVGAPIYDVITGSARLRKQKLEEVFCPVSLRWIFLNVNPSPAGLIIVYFDITEQVEARRLASQRKEQFRTLVETLPDAVNRWNPKLQLIYANSVFEKITGFSNTELYGKDNIEMGYPDEIALPWMERLRQVFATAMPRSYYDSVPTPAGITDFYVLLVPEFGSQGQVETVLTIARDITELRNAEKEMRKSKDLLQSMFNATRFGITMIQAIRNRQGTIIDFVNTMANSVAEQMVGRNFIGLNMLEDFPTAKTIGVFDEFVKGVETGSFVDFERSYKGEGVDSCFRWTAVKFGDGLLVTTEDISARKKAEEQLKEQAHFITHIAGRSPYMIAVLDIALNKMIYINQACEKFFGLIHGEVQNTVNGLWQQLIVPEDLAILKRLFDKVMKSETDDSFEAEYRVYAKDKQVRWLQNRSTIFKRDANGIPIQILCFGTDVTEKKKFRNTVDQLNLSLIKNNRELERLNSELKTFSSIAANDFKQPLQKIYTALELIIINEARSFSNEGKANLRRAQSAVQKMNLLTEDIISFADVGHIEDELTNVELDLVCRMVKYDLRDMISQTAARISYIHLPSVPGYPLLLSLLFSHIITNSVKFRKPGIPPHIEIAHQLENEGPGTFQKITITDHGIGFPSHLSDKVFELFYRIPREQPYKGSGTGLAICKKIMELHGGHIRAESVPDIFTSIICYFPNPD